MPAASRPRNHTNGLDGSIDLSGCSRGSSRALRRQRGMARPSVAQSHRGKRAELTSAIAWSPTISASSRIFFACLVDHGCDVTVVPAKTSAEDVLALKPDGVFLSNGPGDPEPITYARREYSQASGPRADLRNLPGPSALRTRSGRPHLQTKFGHHGANHPVKNLLTEKIEITSQNHGFCVDPDSLPSSDVEITHVNLNDHTNEGMRHRSLPLFSVQYHPEASPGPHDARYLFDQFLDLMATHNRA